MAVDCRADRCGQRRGRGAVCVYCVDGRAAVVAEAFGVELVIRMLCIEFHAVQKRVLHVVGREVESPLVDAVGCGAYIVIRCVVRNAEAGAKRGQNLVLRRGHVLDGRVVLDDGVILVVVRPAGEDHHAAIVVERLEGVQLVLGIGLRILLGRFQTAGRSRQDDGLVLGIAAGRDELLAGLQHDRAHGIFRGQLAEVAHGVLIVACNVFVVVRGVNADVDKLACVKHIERDVLGERVLLAVLLDHSRDLNSHDAGLCRGILEFHILRAACSQRDGIRHGADGFAADGIGDGLDGSRLCLTVEERGGDGQFFVGDRGRRAAFSLGNAKLERFADPDGSGHGQIAVALGDADEVIGVLRRQFHADGALGEIRSTVPCIGDLAGVDDQLDLGDGIGAVGIVEGDLEVQLLRNVNDGAHHVAVDRVVQFEVLVLGGVHTARSERCVDAVFGKVVGQDDVAGVVGVAPAALVVILVVGRGDVPALVERHDVLLVAGIIAACADLAFAVADFDHVHTGVNDRIPITEVNEVAERRARMVELADGVGALFLRQELVVGLQASILGLVVERRVVAGDNAGGVEGVDMAGTAGPRHFKARDGDHAACIFRIERSDRVLIGFPGFLAVFRRLAHVVERALGVGCAGLVKVVGMVGERDEVNVRAVRQRLDIRQRAFQRASAVGILRVGVQLAEVALEGRLADGEGPGLAGFLFIRTLDRHSYRGLAVRHIGSRGVGDLAVCVGRTDLRAVDSHRDAGVLASVRDLRGDLRPLFGSGLRTLRRLHVGDHSLVENVYGVGRSGLVALDILEREGQGHRAASLGRLSDVRIIDRDMDAALAGGEIARNLYVRVALQLAEIAGDVRSIGLLDTVLDPRIVDFIDCVDLEVKLVIAADIGREHGFGEGDGGLHDKAAVHIHAVRHGIEEEGVDCIVKIAGLAVHAVDLERVGEILQPLAVAAELRRAALQLIAAHAAGAGTDEPVRVFGRNALFGEVLAVERVVAGAVGTEIAIRIALEAEVFAVLLDGEHDCAVCRGGLAVRDGGCRLFNGLGIVLRRQNRLCVLVVDHELVAGLGQIAGRLIGAAVVHDQIELLGKQRLIAADAAVAAPVALIGVPLQIVAACGVLDIEAVFGLRSRDVPCGVHIVQRRAAVACAHGEFLALAGGERVGAVRVDTDRPDVGLGVAGQLAVCQRHIRALVIEAGVLGGQGLAVGRVEDHDRVAVGQAGHDAALADAIERLRKQRLVAADAAVAAPVALIGVPLQIIAAHGVLDVIAAGRCSLGNLPCGVHVVQRRAAVACAHGKLLAVLGGERVRTVRVDADRPDVSLGVAGQRAVRQRHIRALVVEAGVFSGQGLHVSRVVDDDLLAVLEQRAGRGLRIRIGIRLFAGIYHKVELLLEGGPCAGIRAPIVVLGKPLQAVFIGAAGIVDIIGRILAVNSRDLPCVVCLTQRGAGIVRIHGELLAVLGCKGKRAVFVDANRPKVSLCPASEIALFQRHIRAFIIEAGIFGGQRLAVGRVEDHDSVAILNVLNCNDTVFTGRRGFELVQRKVAGIAARLFCNRFVFVSSELVIAARVTGKRYSILARSSKGKFAVSKAGCPFIAARLDAVRVAALRCDRSSLCVRHDDAVCIDGQRPDACSRIFDLTVDNAGLCCKNPAVVKIIRRIIRICHKYILAGRQFGCTCDLGVGLRCPLRHGDRHGRQDHDDGQQQRKAPRCAFSHASFPPDFFTKSECSCCARACPARSAFLNPPSAD